MAPTSKEPLLPSLATLAPSTLTRLWNSGDFIPIVKLRLENLDIVLLDRPLLFLSRPRTT